MPRNPGMTNSKEPSSKNAVTGRKAPAQVVTEASKLPASRIGEMDLHLFNEGTHNRLYNILGAHVVSGGTQFGMWAPNARRVTVAGDFNGWATDRDALSPVGSSGLWEGFVPGLQEGDLYKYAIQTEEGHILEKMDPLGFAHEVAPRTGSVVSRLEHPWNDGDWMKSRGARNHLNAPMSVYEVHLGSWRRVIEEDHRCMTYLELAHHLVAYVKEMGFTHVEFLPVMEHPFYGSWGYQVTGYFAATSRYGKPEDLMRLIDVLHQHEIGVILDWVPAHFPTDAHALGDFDGTHLYEHADPRQGFHPDWKSYIFNYGRHEVRSFLLSSAHFWLDRYHADGLRVDGVASMLYLDYSREEGEWVPNEYGGRENLPAIQLFRTLNESIYSEFPDVQTVAEESTSWPMVSRPTYLGGLGFGLKWDMGWMHDTLEYIQKEPIHRKYHHNELTFRAVYAFHENFMLPLSHDEVVHGKGSLLSKMPGNEWQKMANLRLLLAYMFAMPGKKLLFMGAEVGQWGEWHHDTSVEWHLLEYEPHAGLQRLVKQLNATYRGEEALHRLDCEPEGFAWVEANDAENSVLAFQRHGGALTAPVIAVFNFTPVPRENFRLGVDDLALHHEIFNSDACDYGGSGRGNLGAVEASPIPWHGRQASLNLVLPPLSAVYLKPVRTL